MVPYLVSDFDTLNRLVETVVISGINSYIAYVT